MSSSFFSSSPPPIPLGQIVLVVAGSGGQFDTIGLANDLIRLVVGRSSVLGTLSKASRNAVRHVSCSRPSCATLAPDDVSRSLQFPFFRHKALCPSSAPTLVASLR